MKKTIYYSLLTVFAAAALLMFASCGKEGLKNNLDGSNWSGSLVVKGVDSVALADGSVVAVPNVDSVVMRAVFNGGQCRLYGYAVVYRLIDSTGELVRQSLRPVDCVGPYDYKEGKGEISTSVEAYAARLPISCDEGKTLTISIPEGYLLPKDKIPAISVVLTQETEVEW